MKRSNTSGKHPKRFLSFEELSAAAHDVIRRAVKQQTVAAIGGGFAMQAWGSDRLTTDLDIIAESPLGFKGTALTFGGVSSKLGDVPVDVIVRSDHYAGLYDEALVNAVGKFKLPFIRPEYLVAMKMAAGRDKDWLDIGWLILNSAVSKPKTLKIVTRFLGPYAATELQNFIEEIEWKASRGKA